MFYKIIIPFEEREQEKEINNFMIILHEVGKSLVGSIRNLSSPLGHNCPGSNTCTV